jgi:hypothetical protein
MASIPGPYGGMGRQFEMPPLSHYEGSGSACLNVAPEGGVAHRLAGFSVYTKDKRFIDLFNSGIGMIEWNAEVSDDWVQLSENSGRFQKEQRIWVTIDWAKAPSGAQRQAAVVFNGTGKTLRVAIPVFNPSEPAPDEVKGFVESHGYVSIEAEHYTEVLQNGRSGLLWEGKISFFDFSFPNRRCRTDCRLVDSSRKSKNDDFLEEYRPDLPFCKTSVSWHHRSMRPQSSGFRTTGPLSPGSQTTKAGWTCSSLRGIPLI